MGAPSPEPLTFAQADRLNLKPFCERLEKYLLVDFDYADGSLVTALNAGFGCGKTTFLEMWKNDLLARRDSSTAAEAFTAPMPVMLNAWESDYCGDPLVAILAGLLKALDDWKGKDSPPTSEKTALRKSANKIAWCAAALTNDLVAKATGMNAAKALEFAEKQTAPKQQPIPDFIRLFEDRKTALHELKTQMEKTFAGDSPKVIVFVDELDRCRPDYAVSYLETIKHVFNVKGMIFLLAVDLHHLEVSAKSLFGNDLNFDEYFRKFCHRRFDLPKPEQIPMQKLLEEYIAKYVAIAGRRSSLFKPDPEFIQNAAHLALALEMTPRQIQEAFRIFGHVLSISDGQSLNSSMENWIMGTIFLCYLRIKRHDLYQQFHQGTSNHKEICTHLKEIMGKDEVKPWLKLYLTGIAPTKLDPSLLKDTLYQYIRETSWTSPDWEPHDFLHSYAVRWNGANHPLQKICQKIEAAECLE